MKLIYMYLMAIFGCLTVKSINGQGIPPTPTNFVASPLASSISLTWTYPQDDPVDDFEIYYTYTINECNIGEGTVPPVTVPLIDGTARSYTIMRSSTTSVEEDSEYTVQLTAIINGTRSNPVALQTTTPTAAPGPPPSLIVRAVDVSSITIQWDPVPCQDLNRDITNYRVTFHPSSNPRDEDFMILGENDRVYTLNRLPPRTNYTFRVQAVDLGNFVAGVAVSLIASTSKSLNFSFLLNGQLYPNNSVVTVTDIGRSFFMSALFCLTPSLECCSDSETPNEASVVREWYLPDGRPVSSAGTAFSREQVSSAVGLYRSGGTSPTGVFRCEIPDASGNSQNIYVGIYSEGEGSPSITSVVFDRNSTTLTCTSTGGPPTTVSWRKNGVPVNTSLFQQSQRLMDAESATYLNTLFSDSVADFVGTFTCEIRNSRQEVMDTVELNGISVIRDRFNVGDSGVASCVSDDLASRMEWINNGTVIKSDTSTMRLDLMFSPVNDSIHNQVYVCRVMRVTNGKNVTAMQNFTVNVAVPSTVLDTTVSSSGVARAGMIYNLTCTVSKTVDGLVNSPTAFWTDLTTETRRPISNGNGIAVSTVIADMVAVSILTFDPMRTFHGGKYSCNGTLTSPALEIALMPSIVQTLHVQISTPDIVVTAPSGPLFAGSTTPLILTCAISIDPATDITITAATVEVTWSDSIGVLTNSSRRVTILPLSGSGLSYTSILTLTPANIGDSTFFCEVMVAPPLGPLSFITSSEKRGNRIDITIEVPSPPTLMITPFDSLVLAGEPLTLTCSASIQEGIGGTPTLMWTREGGELPNEATSTPPLLTFSTLRTSHGGRYTCSARLTIAEAGVDITGVNSANVSIQIPHPTVSITSSPRNVTFHPGLVVTFFCVVEVHPSVDTPVTVEGNWERNGTRLQESNDDRTSVINSFLDIIGSPNRYQISLIFNPMTFGDSGLYRCSATVTPQNSEFVSEHPMLALSQRRVYVEGLPLPNVTVSSRQPSADECGEARILNCTTKLADGFISTPSISWIAPDGTPVSTAEGANPRLGSITNQLIFSDISAANSGEYMCRLSVGAGFGAVTSININLELPGIPRNLTCTKTSRPSDLIFSWDSPTSRSSEFVGYIVQVKRLSHRDSTREVIQHAIADLFTPMTEVILAEGLAAEVPYSITVKAVNLAGCGEESQVYCFTQEGQELPTPEDVTITRSNTTSIQISWRQFTLVELKALANYTITYIAASALNKRQTASTINVPWTENRTTITNLNPGESYDITVSTTSMSRMSGRVQVRASTLSLPSTSTILPIIVGIVVPVVVVLLVILVVIVLIFVIAIKRRRATLKLEKTRMLRAFDQPADIMMTRNEEAPVDLEKKGEVMTNNAELQEKPPLDSAGECELVQSPVHVPKTFTASANKNTTASAVDSSTVQVHEIGAA